MAEVFLSFSLETARYELTRIFESLPVGSTAGSLCTALRTAYSTQAAFTTSGLIVSGTSANGFSTTFSVPGQGADKPQDRQNMLGYLYELASALTIQTSPASDAELYAHLLANLEPARSVLNDYSGLRV